MAGFRNDVMYANNVDFSGAALPAATVTTDAQLLIGATASPHIKVGTLTSPLNTISIGYSSPNITLDLAGGAVAIEKVNVQTGTTPIVPSAGAITINGATVSAGTNPVRTDGTGANTMAVEVQISQAIAATDATKIGLAAFNSADFTVDANGFVSTNGAGLVWTDEAISFAVAVSNGYFCTAALTASLPASPTQGQFVIIACDTAGAVVVKANTGQFIRVGSGVSTSAGTMTSTAIGDSLTLYYRASDTTWISTASMGNWTPA